MRCLLDSRNLNWPIRLPHVIVGSDICHRHVTLQPIAFILQRAKFTVARLNGNLHTRKLLGYSKMSVKPPTWETGGHEPCWLIFTYTD